MTAPKLSVILPVYNVFPFLEPCVDTLLDQILSDLEIILVDDGSTDGTGQLCDGLKARDTRIVVIHQANAGVSAARNTGLAAARGEYIGFADPDDWVEPEMFADLIGHMESDGTDAAFCGYWEDFEGTDAFAVARTPEKTGVVSGAEAFYHCMTAIGKGYFTSVWNKCFRRSVVLPDAGEPALFPLGHSIGEDELWLAQNYRRWRSVSLTDKPWYHWRQRAGSALRLERMDSRWYQALETKREVFDFLPPDRDFRDMVEAKLYADMYHCIRISHCVGTREDERNFRRALAPYRDAFFKSGEHSRLKKIKFVVLDGMCRMHLPKRWILLLGNTTRVKLQHKLERGKEEK